MHEGSMWGQVRLALKLGAGVSAMALAAGSAMAQTTPAPCPNGTPGPVCTITVSESSGAIVGNTGNALIITNNGAISGAPAINVGGAVLLNLTNNTGATITGTNGTAVQLGARSGIPLLTYAITNRGTIEGNVSVVEPTSAPLPSPGLATGITYYISDGGTLNGNLQLGTNFGTANFFQRGADDGVTGTISAGGGIDIYTRAYSGTQSVALGAAPLPSTFEVEGFEVMGANSVLTLTGTSTSGANFSGNGNVILQGTINAINPAPFYPSGANVVFPAIGYYQTVLATQPRPNPAPGTPGLYTFFYGNALESFTSNGAINGDIRLATASFVNNGEINQVTSGVGSVITGGANKDFLFRNTGTVATTVTGARPQSSFLEREITDGVDAAIRVRSAINTTDPGNAAFDNQGSITGGLDIQVAANNFSFENSGLIEGIETEAYFTRGLRIGVGELDFVAGLNPEDEFNAATATIRNLATGQIRHGFGAEVAANEFSFSNEGTISASGREEGTALYLGAGLLEHDEVGEDLDAARFDFTNSGTIDGALQIETEVTNATFVNSGSITRTVLPLDQNNPPLFDGGVGAIDIETETAGNQTISFTNTGTILAQDRGGTGLGIEIEAGDDDIPGSTATATVTIVNSGQIRALGGAVVTPGPLFGQPQTTNYVAQIAAVGVDAESIGANSVSIVNQQGGLIEAGGTLNALIKPQNQPYSFFPVTTAVPGAHTVAVAVSAQTVNITNSGTIKGSSGTDYSANDPIIDNAIGQPNKYLAGAIHTSGDQLEDDSGFLPSTDKVVNTATGVIIGSIDLGAGDDRIDNAGSITGDIFLREGNDTFVNTGAMQGEITLGSGDDTFSQLLSAAAQFDATVDAGEGNDSLIFDITGSNGQFTPEFRARFTNFEVFNLTGSGTGTIDTGNGTVVLNPGTEITAAPGEAAISGDTGSAVVANAGTVNGDVDLAGGANQFQNQGVVNGDLMIAGGSNVVANQGQVVGDVVASGGGNQIANAPGAQIMGNVTFDAGGNTLTNQGAITGTVTFASGNNTATNAGTITGAVTAGAGTDQIVNTGTINGSVALGGGGDSFVLSGSGRVTGTVDGGTGTDALTLATSGTEAQRTTINGSQFTNFEQLSNTAGTNQLTGTLNVGTVAVTGGYLVGAAGSTIAGNVTVSGGTFGSAGTVNGNVTIAGGTFSPGASPAIMRINGNLAIGNGTTTTFEFVPTGQSDQIIVTGGSVTIGSNTTVNLTGSLTPGSSRDLIIVNGGGTISGTFTTVNRQAGIVGVLRYNSTVLQLLGTFVAPSGISAQANAGVNYINSLFTAGTASSSLLTAVPTLLDGGNASAAAFNLINGEAYASASQFGVQHGMALMRAGRSGFVAPRRSEAGAFSFAQGFGDWRRLKGNGAIGTATASGSAYGLLGGLGYGSRDASIAAFIGYIDGRQTISALRARTDADGVVAGVAGRFASGGFSIGGTIAYDWSKAHTRRSVAGGTTVFSGDYGLRSWVIDATAGYDIAMPGNWSIRPEVGITHISTRRAGTAETGSAAFALTVDADRTKATFIDGGIKLNGNGSEDSVFHPWLQLGIRHQLEGNVSGASAGFVGNTARFTVLGAGRKDTVGTAGVGGDVRLSSAASLFGAYQGEFGNGRSHNLTVGVRFGF